MAKFIITTLVSLPGCTSLWQSRDISLSEGLGWSEMVDLVVAGLGVRSGALLCRQEWGRRAAKGKKQMERRKKKIIIINQSFMSGAWINASNINIG